MQNYNFYPQAQMGLKLERADLDSVRKYNVMPGQTVYFLSNSEPHFYTKTCDAQGNCSLRGFTLTEFNVDKMIENKQFVTREDLDNFKSELLTAIKGVNSNGESGIQHSETTNSII